MSWTCRAFLAGVAVGTLSAATLYPAQNQATGIVLEADQAYLGESRLTNGTSIFVGDVVRTESDGHAQLRVRQSIFQLIGETDAAFFPGPSGAVAELRHGTIIIALNSASEGFEIFASDVRIVPKTDRPILAQVTMNSSCDLQIKVQHGTLEATAGKETKTLEETHSYDVIPEFSVKDSRNPAISPDESAYHRGHEHTSCALAAKWGSKPPAAGLSHFKIIAGVAAGGAVALLLLNRGGGGDTKPISPFVP